MKKKIRRLVSAAIILCLPSCLVGWLLNLLGHKVGKSCRFGFSLILTDALLLKDQTRIGHMNLIKARSLLMREHASIGRMNLIFGPIDIIIGKRSIIGNKNKVVRGPQDTVVVGRAVLKLGELSSLTADHRVDCTKSIRLGSYTTVAGAGTQIWTHGYVHDMHGPGRYRIDGAVTIGNNVYIGARCIVSMGVRIASGVMVGAGTAIARDLEDPGLYVSAAIRQLPRPAAPESRDDLVPVKTSQLCERVYQKT
jgi:acetyltransferase-like isoleucine patch superfamily enzyme